MCNLILAYYIPDTLSSSKSDIYFPYTFLNLQPNFLSMTVVMGDILKEKEIIHNFNGGPSVLPEVFLNKHQKLY